MIFFQKRNQIKKERKKKHWKFICTGGELLDDLELPSFKHLLVVFGGVKGLEFSLETDETITETEVELLFDYYVNTCPAQGSRTIRTEEAILVTLSALRPKLPGIT